MRADKASPLIDTQPAKVWPVLTDVAGWRGCGSHRRSSGSWHHRQAGAPNHLVCHPVGRLGGHPVGAHAVHEDAIRRVAMPDAPAES